MKIEFKVKQTTNLNFSVITVAGIWEEACEVLLTP
jgi:hypothetical protein